MLQLPERFDIKVFLKKQKSLKLVQIRKGGRWGGHATRCRLRERAGKKKAIYSFAVNPTVSPRVSFRQQKC